MKFLKTLIICFVSLSFLFISCSDDESNMGVTTDSYDRNGLLENWADHIIIPAFEAYTTTLMELQSKNDNLTDDPSIENLQTLREAYIDAYKAWQKVSMFDIGKAEEIGLRNYTNIYPTDEEAILEHIASKAYNLELPSNFDAQGFPALDFLLYGVADTDEGVLNFLQTENYNLYLLDLIARLNELSLEVLNDWKNSYREIFISNVEGSATGSIDKLVNDFLYYYEKFFRAGKIGIPAGRFSGTPLPNTVEAPYSKIHSKTLFLEAFQATQDFYEGKSFEENVQFNSLGSFVDHMIERNNGEDISAELSILWSNVDSKAELLSPDFSEQIVADNSKMLETYDEIQKTVILLKVDMMQALNIQVDYVDADGD